MSMRTLRLTAALLIAAAACITSARPVIHAARNGAGTTTVTWREPTRKGDNSAASDIASYNIKYGLTSGTHGTVINVTAPATTRLLSGLSVGVPIYVVITAVRSGGAESPESAEITYTPL